MKVGTPRLIAVTDLRPSKSPTVGNLAARQVRSYADLTQDQRDFLDAFHAATPETQNIMQILGHHYAGKPWTPQMRMHLNALAYFVVHREAV